jgi:poly-gamma-glutamate capsule biosynthesis protein CapA/YwtB (metallophosphatase superfamily)
MKNPHDEIIFCAVGDICPSRPDPDSLFTRVSSELQRADIAFCQLEVNLTTRGTRLPQARHTDRTGPEVAHAIRRAGFNVVSFAGNHCMDWGTEGFFDTIAALKDAGLQVIGVGANIEEARTPVVMQVKGSRIGFLAYNSILPMGYWAEQNRPGCAPLRAWTHYEQVEHDQPGTPCRIHTWANQDDLRALVEDIEKLKSKCDVVIVSMHWGIHFVPAVIADYQRQLGRAAIDAGADLILGHHAHILKGVEVYKDVPVLYSLCNFAMDLPMTREHAARKSFKEIQKLNPNWEPDFESTYNFPLDSRKSLIVKCVIADKRIKRISLLPVYIDRQSVPEILPDSDPRFAEVQEYLEQISKEADLNGSFNRENGELLIKTRKNQLR